MLQYLDQESLGKENGYREDTIISLGRENKLDFAGGLGTSWGQERGDQVRGKCDRGREYGES